MPNDKTPFDKMLEAATGAKVVEVTVCPPGKAHGYDETTFKNKDHAQRFIERQRTDTRPRGYNGNQVMRTPTDE